MNRRMSVRAVVGLIFCLLFVLHPEGGPLGAEEVEDLWGFLRPLVGTWVGEGSGFGSTSDVVHEWQFVLNQKFLRLSTRSTSRVESSSGEIHEDVGGIRQHI